MKHQARPIVTGYQSIKGIDHPVAVWTPDCQDCHRPAYARRAMGIDWMMRDELREAIPPAYTEYIGKQILESL